MLYKTASEMTYIVSSGALNSTPTNQRYTVIMAEITTKRAKPVLVHDTTAGR